MKYIVLGIISFFMIITSANADYLEDVRNLGYVSGEGLACGATYYPQYETIGRAFIISSARSDEEQAKGEYEYNLAKAEAYLNKRHMGRIDCDDVNIRFNNQKIFKTKVYKSGKLIMPDGKVIVPRKKYNISKVYDNMADEKTRLDEKYKQVTEKNRRIVQREGIYQKIRQDMARSQY